MPEAQAWQFKHVKSLPDRRTEEDKRIVLKGRVFTGVAGGLIENGFVRIEDDRIAAVGSAGDLTGDEAGSVLEVGDGLILPGLFNNHAHLAWDGVNDLAAQALDDESEISAYKCAANMRRSLDAGVTSVRDLGMNRTAFYAKQAVAQKVIEEQYGTGQALQDFFLKKGCGASPVDAVAMMMLLAQRCSHHGREAYAGL